KHVSILAIPQGLASSITIPMEMIRAADVIRRIRTPHAPAQVLLIASQDGRPVTMTGGIRIAPEVPIRAITKTDLIFVPALWGNPNAVVRRHPAITAWLKACY